MENKPTHIIERSFAWLPVYIRNRISRKPSGWVWFKKYVRVYTYSFARSRYVTFDTFLDEERNG